MASPLRIQYPGAFYHVTSRGNERKAIFRSNRDREKFLSYLQSAHDRYGATIHVYCLMDNHFHLLCKTNQRPLSSSMQRLLTGYVVNFNKSHKRHGYLFQNRYKSIICQEDAYFTELVRYIHLNPIRAGIVKDAEGLNRYKWSGHSALTDNVKRVWQDTDYVLSFFGAS